jgi:MFS family permease
MSGYGELLRTNRHYRRLWTAEVVSFLGDWFNTIALYTIVQEMSGSGRAIALVMVAKTLPVFLVVPLAGPIVDRFDRRMILIASDVARAGLAILLIVAHRAGNLPALYAVMAVMVALAGVFLPARNAAIPQVTTPDELARANALSGGTWSVMLAFGAALGGWVTEIVGTDAALALDGLTFLAAAVILGALPKLPAPGGDTDPSRRSFVAGLRYLAEHRRIIALVALKPMMAIAGGALVVLPIFGQTVFPGQGGPSWVGFLYSARGLGALIGSVVLIRLFGDRSRTMRRIILVAFPAGGAAYMLLGRAGSPFTAALCYFAAAIASGSVWVLSGTLLQREGDPRYLGRIFSVEFGLMTLVISVMGWMAGVALDVTSMTPQDVATVSGALLLVPFLVWGGYLSAARRARDAASERRGAMPPHVGAAPEAFEAAPGGEDDG